MMKSSEGGSAGDPENRFTAKSNELWKRETSLLEYVQQVVGQVKARLIEFVDE